MKPIFYLCNNSLFIYDNKNYNEINLRNCVYKNSVVNENKFIIAMKSFFKNNNDVKKDCRNGIIFISDIKYNNFNRKCIYDIFYNFGIDKVLFYCLFNYVCTCNRDLVIYLSTDYFLIFYNNNTFYVDSFLYRNNILKFIESIMYLDFKRVIILGGSSNLCINIENKIKVKVFYVRDVQNFLFNLKIN